MADAQVCQGKAKSPFPLLHGYLTLLLKPFSQIAHNLSCVMSVQHAMHYWIDDLVVAVGPRVESHSRLRLVKPSEGVAPLPIA